MELSAYLRSIRDRWWIVLTTVVIATAGAVALVRSQPPVYESIGTMLLRPAIGTPDAIDASDLLIRGVKIGSTYATVARSDLIRDRAEEAVDPSIDTSDVDVEAELLTDTNIVSISTRGTDPEAVQALGAAIQEEMEAYVASVDEAYDLVPLDAPRVPNRPVAPNKVLTVAVGFLLGLSAGIGLVLLERYLRGRAPDTRVAQVVDPRTGLHNEAYVRERLHEETSRSRRTGHGFSFAYLRVGLEKGESGEVVDPPSRRDLRKIGQALRETTLPEAVLGYLGASTFAAVLPDVRSEEAEEMLPAWESAAAAVFAWRGDGVASRVRVTAGTCHYHDERFSGDAEALQVASVLTDGDAGAEPAPEPRTLRTAPKATPNAGSSHQRENGGKNAARPARLVSESAQPHPDPRGDTRRRRAGWKGSRGAGDRSG